MIVSIDATGSEQKVVGSPGTQFDYTGLTSTAAAQAILLLITTNNTGGVADIISSVVWDQGGVNQTMTEIAGSPLIDDVNWSGNVVSMRMFGIVLPNSFGNKTIRVNFSAPPDTGLTAVAISFIGNKTSSVAACFTNWEEFARTGQTESFVTITSKTGDHCIAMHALGATVTGANETTIFTDSASLPNSACNRAIGATSVTLTASMLLSSNIDVIGVNIEAEIIFSQTDWPNPQRRKSPIQDWFASGNALTAIAPTSDFVVLRAPYKASIWLPIAPVNTQPLGSAEVLLTVPVEAPLNQHDWPNPRGRERARADWQDSFKLPLQGVLPLNQYDWPLPRGPRRNPQDWRDSFKLPLQEVLPPSQHDWPNPRDVQRGRQDWGDSFKLPLQTIVPLNQYDWPNPPLATRRSRPDFQSAILPLIEPVVLFPVSTPRDWPNPRGSRRNPQDWQDSFKLPLQTIVPLNQRDWPNPQRGPKRNLQDLLVASMFIPAPEPAPEPAQHALMGQIWME